mmetsp:Transcript_8435/g.15495  ORF Transcript_8435/g.15495 Transcript_8435/m.15495 type:complete len:294 (-) Transcript_8435:2760-3641(-)
MLVLEIKLTAFVVPSNAVTAPSIAASRPPSLESKPIHAVVRPLYDSLYSPAEIVLPESKTFKTCTLLGAVSSNAWTSRNGSAPTVTSCWRYNRSDDASIPQAPFPESKVFAVSISTRYSEIGSPPSSGGASKDTAMLDPLASEPFTTSCTTTVLPRPTKRVELPLIMAKSPPLLGLVKVTIQVVPRCVSGGVTATADTFTLCTVERASRADWSSESEALNGMSKVVTPMKDSVNVPLSQLPFSTSLRRIRAPDPVREDVAVMSPRSPMSLVNVTNHLIALVSALITSRDTSTV